MIRVMFFAALREQLGRRELTIDSTDIQSFEALMGQLSSEMSGEDLQALTDESILVAINQVHVADLSTIVLSSGDEVAFFPPVTGG